MPRNLLGPLDIVVVDPCEHIGEPSRGVLAFDRFNPVVAPRSHSSAFHYVENRNAASLDFGRAISARSYAEK